MHPRKLILLVGPDVPYRNARKFSLEIVGRYRVLALDTSDEALSLLDTACVRMVIVDALLDNAAQFLEQIRKRLPLVPSLMISPSPTWPKNMLEQIAQMTSRTGPRTTPAARPLRRLA